MSGADRQHHLVWFGASKIVVAVSLTALALGTGALATAGAGGLTANVRCGDVGGLISAMSSTSQIGIINLNSDHVGGCIYTLTTAYGATADGLPPVGRVITVNGGGSTITRSSSSAFRILEVDAPGNFLATRLGITGGLMQDPSGGVGGGILNSGSVTLVNSVVAGNTAKAPVVYGPPPLDYGGGIANTGALTLSNTTLSGNVGGAIANHTGGIVTVKGGTITQNTGGGITNGIGRLFPDPAGSVVITGATVSNNPGGGLSNGFGGHLSVTNSTISGNSGYFGGGIFNYEGGVLALTASTVSGNSAGAGGGICNCFSDVGGTVTITGGAITDNSANRGGGIFSNSTGTTVTVSGTTIRGNSVSGPGILGSAEGGGIFNGSNMLLTRTAVTGNSGSEGGGIFNDAGATLDVNVGTISSNIAPPPCYHCGGRGGGVSNYGTLVIDGGAVRNNAAEGDFASHGQGGGIYNAGTAVALGVAFSGNNPSNCEPSGSVTGCRG